MTSYLPISDWTTLFNQRFFQNLFPIPPSNTLKSGENPPDFELFDITNQRLVKLADYRGSRPVLLAFTRIFTEKYYCPVCFPHIIELNQKYQQFVDLGGEVLMITSTDEQQSQKVVQDLGLKMPLVSDASCRIFRNYGTGQAWGAPLSAQFLLDKDGRLKFKHLFSFLSPNADIDWMLKTMAENL
jgi:peroxiredoxin